MEEAAGPASMGSRLVAAKLDRILSRIITEMVSTGEFITKSTPYDDASVACTL